MFLIKNGADIKVVDSDGRSMLDLAIASGKYHLH